MNDLGMTQKELAKRLLMTERQLSRILKSKTSTRAATIVAIAQILEMRLDDFKDYFEEKNVDYRQKFKNIDVKTSGGSSYQQFGHIIGGRQPGKSEPSDTVIEEIIAHLEQLSEADRKFILRTIKGLLSE